MKKKIITLFPLLFLVGCAQVKDVAPVSSGEDTIVTYENDLPTIHRDGSGVITYLMLSKYGRAVINDQEIAGVDVPEKFYENCVAYEAAVGTDLPEAVSTLDDVVFRGWYYYKNNIYPEKITKVQAASGPVYAIFDGPTGGSGGGGGGGGGGGTTIGYGLKFTDGTEYHATYNGQDEATGTFEEYSILNASFTTGKSFQLFDFGQNAGWVIDVDGWSFGGTSASDTKWMTYLAKGASTYTVLKDFTADIYIKLKFEQDNIYFGLK